MLGGDLVVTGSSKQAICIWSLEDGSQVKCLNGHNGSVNSLCVLPDGRMASASTDNTIRLWDIAATKEVARLEVDSDVKCIAALHDGSLVAGDQLGRVHWLKIVE